MNVQINHNDQLPLYLQVAYQIRRNISAGELPHGSQLPSIRMMADRLGVNAKTVKFAYDELQSQGWIETQTGRGTFVAEKEIPQEVIHDLNGKLTPNEMLDWRRQVGSTPGIHSLAQPVPDPDLNPAGEFWAALYSLRTEPQNMFEQGLCQGDPNYRITLAQLLRQRGIYVTPDEIIAVSGYAQGLSLVLQAFTKPGDFVVVEEPTPLSVLAALEIYNLNAVPVPIDENGPVIECLEEAAECYNPQLMLLSSNFHCPTGYLVSCNRRDQVQEIAQHYNLLIVENDEFGWLSYDTGSHAPSYISNSQSDNVIYLSTFSKVLMPGLSLGMVIASGQIQQNLLQQKRVLDSGSLVTMQRAFSRFVEQGDFSRHIQKAMPKYEARRNFLLRSLSTQMCGSVTWTHPVGGFSCLITLPSGVDEVRLCIDGLKRGFAYCPGQIFLKRPTNAGHIQICFGNQPEEIIWEAVSTLRELITDYVWAH